MWQLGPSSRHPLLTLTLLMLAAAAQPSPDPSPGPSPRPSRALEVAEDLGRPAGIASCRCCLNQTPRRGRCTRASCRVRSCSPEECTGVWQCHTPAPPVPSPSPSASTSKRQVSLNWQPLTLQEARALLKRRRPGALLKKRPPPPAHSGQARGV